MLSKTKVKYIQSLGQKKGREQEGLFIAEGPKLVADLLEHQKNMIVAIYALPHWVEAQATTIKEVEVTMIDEMDLQKISQLSTPNQVVAIVKQFNYTNEINTKDRIVLVLDGIQDPGNMGTIIRTADWFGVEEVVCSTDSVEQYNPKVVQATMGSITRVQVHYKNLISWLMQVQVPVYVTALEGEPLQRIGKLKNGIIVIGNEGKGVSEAVMKLATQFVTIPKAGGAESLNASVATGVILSHLL
jgi:RNA methyltransferase, TrmH family